MILLDENFPRFIRLRLLASHIAARQIGYEISYRGIKDEQILPLLHSLRQPTLFTFDLGLYRRRHCHAGHCIICLDIDPDRATGLIKRVLRHSIFDTSAKRMGKIVQVSPAVARYWQFKSAIEHALKLNR